MSGRNWTRDRDRQRMQRQGSEKHDDVRPGIFGHLPVRHPRKPVAKAELRQQAALADPGSIVITCAACGHTGRLPKAKARPRAILVCSECGVIVERRL